MAVFALETIECHEAALRSVLLPILRGSVFHVTTQTGLEGIKRDGNIRNNKGGAFPFTFGQSDNSYGNHRGYVCLVDLRDVSDELIDDALVRYDFLNPTFANCNPVFLFISERLSPELIPWTRARSEQAWNEVWIPNVEAWYPEQISIEDVTGGLLVTVKKEPIPYRDALERIWSKRSKAG